MLITSRFFYFSIIAISVSAIFLFSWLNFNLLTSPNDGILYYSIALNIIENFSLNSLMFKEDLIYTPQIGISFILAPLIIIFGDSWYIFFIILISFFWLYSLKDLSKSLELTIFKKSRLFNNKEFIFIFLLLICTMSIMLVRISTSFYNESFSIPLQILLTSKFLIFNFETEKKNSTFILLLLLSFLGVLFRLQFLVVYLALFISLFFHKHLKLNRLILAIVPILGYSFLFYSLESSFHVNSSTSEMGSILSEMNTKIFYSLNSFGILFNLYFLGLAHELLILFIFPLIFLLLLGLKILRKRDRKTFTFFLLIIIGNILFVFLFIPVSFFDDPIRYYWHQLIPLAVLFMIFLDHYYLFVEKIIKKAITLFLLFLFFLGSYFHQDVFNRIEKSLLSNSLKNIETLNEKWNLSNQLIYSDDLRREFFWIADEGTKSINNLSDVNCNVDFSHYILTKEELKNYVEIDRIQNIRLYNVCL